MESPPEHPTPAQEPDRPQPGSPPNPQSGPPPNGGSGSPPNTGLGSPPGPPPRRPPARNRPLLILVLVAALVLIALVAAALATRHHSGGEPPFTGHVNAPQGGRRQRVAAWLTSTTRSLDAAIAARALDQVNCDWYTIDGRGVVSAGPQNLPLVATARAHGVQAFATVTNRPSSKGSFTSSIPRSILSNPDTQKRAIDALVALAVTKGYDGIDIDWELVPASQRDAFSRFMAALAAALHAHQRLLAVAVFAKTYEPGKWDSQKVYDYKALGAVVDELEIMTYSFNGPWSSPGPQAPLGWTKAVIDFARTIVPPRKIYMGLPWYGYDWHAGGATAVQASDAAALIAAHHFKVAHDPASGEADLSYVDTSGVRHVLFFVDRRALATKLGLLESSFPEIGGVAVWQLYHEDPAFWTVIAQKMR
jgi:spore germination protein